MEGQVPTSQRDPPGDPPGALRVSNQQLFLEAQQLRRELQFSLPARDTKLVITLTRRGTPSPAPFTPRNVSVSFLKKDMKSSLMFNSYTMTPGTSNKRRRTTPDRETHSSAEPPPHQATSADSLTLTFEFKKATKEIVYIQFQWEGLTCYSLPICVISHSRDRTFCAPSSCSLSFGPALRDMIWFTLSRVYPIC